MEVRCFSYRPEAWRFKTITEFKDSVNRGAETILNGTDENIIFALFGQTEKFNIALRPWIRSRIPSIKLRRTCWNISLTIPGCVTSLRRRK